MSAALCPHRLGLARDCEECRPSLRERRLLAAEKAADDRMFDEIAARYADADGLACACNPVRTMRSGNAIAGRGISLDCPEHGCCAEVLP